MSPVNITVRNNGPYRVEFDNEGDVRLVDHEGNPVAMPGLKFSLCRCGASSKKPFCDGTHSKIGFKGAQEAAAEFDATKGAELAGSVQQVDAGGDSRLPSQADRSAESRPTPAVREEGPV
ncbi:MAG: CDGSH iron-sulfur domain-containing protein [Anaerolineae bacterium]|nr:CDGSH iron-sulfur domain-containing protein [Gemmatimonadaceae bacterium]